LTLGGGGTDLPSYCSKYGGFVVTSALDKYIYLMVKRRFEEDVRVSYSITEIVKSIDAIRHAAARETLRLLGLKSHLEIVSIGDIPAETGLGSSGSFTVAKMLRKFVRGLRNSWFQWDLGTT
jgi:D-glycero-alpha-D-manno-heptose-7-phosphate kinase